MRKSKLVLDDLAVESFETSAAHGRGTVLSRMPEVEVIPGAANAAGQYNAPATYPECPSPLCVDTLLASCDGSCRAGCITPGTAVAIG